MTETPPVPTSTAAQPQAVVQTPAPDAVTPPPATSDLATTDVPVEFRVDIRQFFNPVILGIMAVCIFAVMTQLSVKGILSWTAILIGGAYIIVGRYYYDKFFYVVVESGTITGPKAGLFSALGNQRVTLAINNVDKETTIKRNDLTTLFYLIDVYDKKGGALRLHRLLLGEEQTRVLLKLLKLE